MNQCGSRMSAVVKVVEADSANWLVIDQCFSGMVGSMPKLTLTVANAKRRSKLHFHFDSPSGRRELSSGEDRIMT